MRNLLSFRVLAHNTLLLNSASKVSKMALSKCCIVFSDHIKLLFRMFSSGQTMVVPMKKKLEQYTLGSLLPCIEPLDVFLSFLNDAVANRGLSIPRHAIPHMFCCCCFTVAFDIVNSYLML